jgi:hypothetical protein
MRMASPTVPPNDIRNKRANGSRAEGYTRKKEGWLTICDINMSRICHIFEDVAAKAQREDDRGVELDVPKNKRVEMYDFDSGIASTIAANGRTNDGLIRNGKRRRNANNYVSREGAKGKKITTQAK